jgi:FtsZ-binding cell division protein ZapB
MEKKFTRAMLCEEFKSKCRECPLFCTNNFKLLPCSVLTDDDIQYIMKDYPYVDVKVRMIFNDIETRLTAVEKKVEKKDEPKFTMFEVIDKKLYDKLEAKHEADCRLISEYDLEIKRLKDKCSYLEKETCDLNKQIDSFGLTCRLYEKETKDLKCDVERLVKRYESIRDMDKKRLFDFKNAEEERDHYKGLYSSKCDDYDTLLEKQLKTEKEVAFYRNSCHECYSEKSEHIEKEHNLKEEVIKLTEQKDRYKEKYDDACKMNKMREDVFEANLKLKKTIEAKDREIDLLRAELDKYKTDDECDDRWID